MLTGRKTKMKISKNLEYSLTEKICQLCCRKNYFSCGTMRQYDLMFTMSRNENITVRDLSIMIWTCSREDALLSEILDDISEIMDEIRQEEEYEKEIYALSFNEIEYEDTRYSV